MKNILCLTVCALSLLAFASTAHSGGGEASGSFNFSLDIATGSVDFTGAAQANGTAHGQMSFSATLNTSVDENGTPVPATVSLVAPFDCVVVHGNLAALSGVITSSNDSSYVGRQTKLVVEANPTSTVPRPECRYFSRLHRL